MNTTCIRIHKLAVEAHLLKKYLIIVISKALQKPKQSILLSINSNLTSKNLVANALSAIERT